MRSRFVVAIQNLTPEKERSLLNFIGQRGLHWWHWIDNVWLLIDPSGRQTHISLRDDLKSEFKLDCLVISVPDKGAGFAWYGTISQFKWLNEFWAPSKVDDEK